jgi:glyoxylase-like metal-dependent hydrolase (beta-lactamase superfamily II)
MSHPPLELRTHAVGPWPVHTFVLVCPATHHSVLIDPGAEPETLTAMLDGTTPQAILLTHTHPDHIGALDVIRAQLGVPLLAHAGPHVVGVRIAPDRTLAHGDTVAVGAHQLQVFHTPGHTADMLCFALANDHRIIVGDTLFDGGPGRTWSAEDFQTTLRTLRDVVLAWPDDSVCYPGHGPTFRLGDRRQAIEAFLARNHGAFFGDAAWAE